MRVEVDVGTEKVVDTDVESAVEVEIETVGIVEVEKVEKIEEIKDGNFPEVEPTYFAVAHAVVVDVTEVEEIEDGHLPAVEPAYFAVAHTVVVVEPNLRIAFVIDLQVLCGYLLRWLSQLLKFGEKFCPYCARLCIVQRSILHF